MDFKFSIQLSVQNKGKSVTGPVPVVRIVLSILWAWLLVPYFPPSGLCSSDNAHSSAAECRLLSSEQHTTHFVHHTLTHTLTNQSSAKIICIVSDALLIIFKLHFKWTRTHTHNHFTALLEYVRDHPVSRYQKGKTRKVKTNLHLMEQEIVSGSGIYWASLHLIPDNHANIPPLSFLQAGCPSCRQTNRIKALKAF